MIINTCKLIILFLLATVCHWAFASFFAPLGFSVNMMLIFVVAFCVCLKPPFAYAQAFLCGLFLDFFSTKLFGNNAFTFTVCACIIQSMVDRFDFEALFPQMVAVFVLTWVVGLLNALLVYLFASASLWPGFFSLLGGAFIDSICAPLVFWIVGKILGQSVLCRKVYGRAQPYASVVSNGPARSYFYGRRCGGSL